MVPVTVLFSVIIPLSAMIIITAKNVLKGVQAFTPTEQIPTF